MEKRKAKRGMNAGCLGGVLTKDAEYKEFATGAVFVLDVEYNVVDAEGFVAHTEWVRFKIWGIGATAHAATGMFKKGTYVYGINGLPKKGKPYSYKARDGTQQTTIESWLDLGSSPLHLGVNPATIGALSSRLVPTTDIRGSTAIAPVIASRDNDHEDIPF